MRFRHRTVTFVIVLLGGALFLMVARAPFLGGMRTRMESGFAPIIAGVDGAASRVRGWFNRGTSEHVRDLERERVELLAEISRREELVKENETLREALSLRSDGEAGVLPATVIGFVREGRDEYLLLDRGTADGIGVGDLVIGKNRALGASVVDVRGHTSRAILFSSGSREVEVLFAGKELTAIAHGNNNREFTVDLVPQGAEVQPGDLIVASPRATGGRRSLLLAEVREVRPAEHEVFKAIRATHLFDPTEQDVLLLLAPE